MRIADLLRTEDVILELRAGSAGDVLPELARFLAAHHPEVEAERLAAALAARERAGSTALAGGLAVPHAKLDSLPSIRSCFARSSRGIAFGSADGGPTRFFFVLVAPARDPGTYLKALAHVSRLFRGGEVAGRLLAAGSREEAHRILTSEEG